MAESQTIVCPACDGAGCEICDDSGRIIPPRVIERPLRNLQSEIYKRRGIRRMMLSTYAQWMTIPDGERDALLANVGETDPREFDLKMTGDLMDCIDQIEEMRVIAGKAEELVQQARDDLRRAKRAARPVTPTAPAKTAPAAPKRTKAGGRVCRARGCDKDPKVWDDKGQGWCRPHAYDRGLLGEPEQQPERKRRRGGGDPNAQDVPS